MLDLFHLTKKLTSAAKVSSMQHISTGSSLERAVIVGLVTKFQSMEKVEEYLNELEFLLETAGGQSVKRFVQALDLPNTRTYVGSGKLEEIVQYIRAENIRLVVFDDELGATQLRNLEKELECKVLDRTNLILDIFARRARTAHAKAQVELAQYEYLLPRLTRMWTHLERQRGGIGMRGPGEREIETDRRVIRDKIALLKKRLAEIDRQQTIQRKSRDQLIRVALVGYTNVGKSTLMNLLSKSDVFAEDKLFATLDTTVRKVVIDNLPFLLSDTVGFIRKLPHSLIESFKSTLDELRESDILLHVVDISHPEFEDQIQTVNQTLDEIGAGKKKTIMVFNKMDAFTIKKTTADTHSLDEDQPISLDSLQQSWMAKANNPSIFISALHRHNYAELQKLLYDEIKDMHAIRYPYDNFLY